MTPSKLTGSDKSKIINLYRSTEETTSTLATNFDVSTTTIRRILKNVLSPEEYDSLTQQKQGGRSGAESRRSPVMPQPSAAEISLDPSAAQISVPDSAEDEPQKPDKPLGKRTRKRSSTPTPPEDSLPSQPEADKVADPSSERRPIILDRKVNLVTKESEPSPADYPAAYSNPTAVENLDEEFLDEEDDDELDDLDDDDLEDDFEDDLDDQDTPYSSGAVYSDAPVDILPLSDALMPRTCYLVIDRFSELITRPLKDFSELGQIPAEEVQEKTLPVFDNHRVARRFSNRTQRVVKIPDGNMLQKACLQLHTKGITRLLINGQVYSL